ncbi:MAG: outer membrane protein assembly factor BamE [Verrucomicrobiaceae bacterium]
MTTFFRMIPIVLLLAGCEGIDTDASGLAKDDVVDAVQRGVVLPGMTPKQVHFIWGDPRERRMVGAEQQWDYNPTAPEMGGPAGYGERVTVFFVKDKVDHVINADLMARGRHQNSIGSDLARRAPRGTGSNLGSPAFPNDSSLLR